MAELRSVTIDVVSDVICPWCFIGKRRMEKALALLPVDKRPSIRWRSYQLQPDAPEGISTPAKAQLEKKFGGARRFEELFTHVRRAGEADGIHFDIDKQQSCNTRLAHRAVAIALAHGRQDAAVEGFFSANFEQGKNLADIDVVVAILLEALRDIALVDEAAVRAALAQGGGADEVDLDLVQARELGVTGVPFFVLDDRLAISGAQDPATFLKFLLQGCTAP